MTSHSATIQPVRLTDSTGTPDRVSALPATTVVRADRVSSRIGQTTILHPTSFSVDRGQIVGIAGGSGAGKTTLLETVAGVRMPTGGRVARSEAAAFVPQDDIIHRELPLRRTLVRAASLRIADSTATERSQIVDRVLDELDLVDQAEVKVADLSGGQRKRASIAAEMLTDARLLFLDEPTSGLDPAKAASLMQSLRQLADNGSTVILSTHSPADLARCDRVIFLARGGQVAFVGSPVEARAFFAVDEMADIYEQLNQWPFDRAAEDETESDAVTEAESEASAVSGDDWATASPSVWRQWAAMVGRNIDLIRGNRLTLAILAGSPIFIISMMTWLFPSGAFDDGNPSAALAVQTLFWMAFNSFFFGLTYGLLQIVGEFEVLKRERRVGLSIGAYVLSKLTVLLPMLAVVNGAQITAMQLTGRLPDLSVADGLAVFASLQLLSSAAVAIGLHASAAVRNPAQATLGLPMLCFPQILFAGAVVPVSEMGPVPAAMSAPLAARWGFESVGRILDLGPAAAQEVGTAGYGEAFTGSPVQGWLVLGALIVVGTAATVRTLHRRTKPSTTR